MSERKADARSVVSNAWLSLALLVGVVLALNLLSDDLFLRFDLTRSRSFTLTPASKELLDKLEDRVTARVYFAEELQPPYHEHARKVRDKLEEYQAHAGGRFVIDWKDPTGGKDVDPAYEEEARRFGIQANKLQVRERNKVELREVYLGVAFVYRDRQEVLPFLADLSTLEYDISRSLKALIEDGDKKTIGLLTGHGEPDLAAGQGQLQSLKAKIEETYRLAPVKLGEGVGVPDEIDALVVVGARQPLSERERFEVDQFVMKGKPAAFFVTQLTPDLRQLKVSKARSGIEDLLTAYGVTVGPDTVLDRENMGALPVPVKRGPFTLQARVSTPLIPVAARVNEDSLLMKGVKALPLPFASPLRVTEAGRDEGRKTTELVWSGESSVAVDRVMSLDPATLKEPGPDEEAGPFVMGLQMQGSFESAFAGKDVPEAATPAPKEGETELSGLLDPEGADEPKGDDATAEKSPDGTRVLVFGSSDFVLGSLDLFQACLDWLVMDDTLLAIRPKPAQSALLEPTTPEKQAAIKAANLLGVPGLLVVFGVVRARRRAAR